MRQLAHLLSPSDSMGMLMLSTIDTKRFAIDASCGQRIWQPVRNVPSCQHTQHT